MTVYTLKQKIFIVKRYYQSCSSTDKVKTEFPTKFITQEPPTCETITELIKLFEEYGTVFECDCSSKKNADLSHVNSELYNSDVKTEVLDVVDEIKLENDDVNFSDSQEISNNIENDTQHRSASDTEDIDSKISNKKIPKVRQNLKCKQCDRQFVRADRFRAHLEKHEKECKICGKQPRNIDQHMRYHTGEKGYVCYVCGLQCFKSDQLHSHMRSHQNERPFTCATCNKSFKTKQDLNRHVKTHVPFDKRPIQCEVCKKRFCFKREFNVHNKTHTGEKTYFCKQCDLGFTTNWSLKMHARTHTGEKPFKCNHCDKAFSRSGSLNIHIRIHTGEKPYSCRICNKTFYDAGSRGVHENKHKT